MNQSTINIIKATAPLVAEHASEITTLFYKTMFANSPEAATFFNVANQGAGRQPQALANAVIAYALNIDNLSALGDTVSLIAAKHCGLQVLRQHYHIVHDNLMIAVAEVLTPAITPEIAAAWSEAVTFLSNILIAAEEKLYAAAESRTGGWRGWKNFVVSDITTTATDTFSLVPEDGSTTAFVFTPGQYLSIRVDVNSDGSFTSPRHYTVTSKSGDKCLQISTKRLENGTVTHFMHDVLTVGGVVQLSPPFGPFTLRQDSSRPAVLISAGIGRTPMKAFLDSLIASGQSPLTVHVDKNEEAVPFRSYFEVANPGRNQYYFTEKTGRPDAAEIIVKTFIRDHGAEFTFYVCGPTTFMQEIAHSLVAEGIAMRDIKWEAFSPQLACPM
ncbi:hmp [Symbiodinium microadriaticum]|nr:hmp [Symbiodinium microadriaticum]